MCFHAYFVLLFTSLWSLPASCQPYYDEPPRVQDQISTSTAFNWSSLPALEHLNYVQCYDGFECSRLEVPLDWTNATNRNKVQLAIIRLPATVPETSASFGGTILLNPGGPGGSGVDFMRLIGHGIREIVDGDKHFEILSWDPRGMHYSTPPLSCFKDDLSRELSVYRNNVIGPMDASNVSLIQKWSLARSWGKLCQESSSGVYADGSSIAQFATTGLIARDMVEIIDAVALLRSLNSNKHQPSSDQQLLRSSGPALLNYWGFSYGSYLGNTFASMFPSRIGRMIMDSVVDTDDYTATGWFSNLQDYHKTLEFFYNDCFDAGLQCALHSHDINRPSDIRQKVEQLLQRLKNAPVIVLHDGIPDIVTFADVSSLLLTTMYSPRRSWVELAAILADLLDNNGTSMARHLKSTGDFRKYPEEDEVGHLLNKGKNFTQPSIPLYSGEVEAGHAVMCGDGDDITHLTIDDWYGRLMKWQSQSGIVGWRWAEHPMLCAHWPKSWRPAEHHRFKGPWSSKLSAYDSRASPLLFISGTADPVLPLRNAFKAAANHEGAHVLMQNAPGHCTGYHNPSKCTWGHIKRFFGEGVLPQNNTICERDDTAWTKA